jgi:hypothetical protein
MNRPKYSDQPATLSRELWQETTEEIYDEMLCVLPPAFQSNGAFLVGEPVTHRNCAITGNCVATYDGYYANYNEDKYFKTAHEVTKKEFLELLNKYRP